MQKDIAVSSSKQVEVATGEFAVNETCIKPCDSQVQVRVDLRLPKHKQVAGVFFPTKQCVTLPATAKICCRTTWRKLNVHI